jgi:hypothetical protein
MSASATVRTQECTAAAAAAADHHHIHHGSNTTTHKPQPQQQQTTTTDEYPMNTMLRLQQGLTLHDIVGLNLSLSRGSNGPALPRRPTTAPPAPPAPVTPDQPHHYHDLALPLLRPRPPLPTTISIRPIINTMASSASDDDDSSPPLLPFLPLALDDIEEDETNIAKRQQRRRFVLKQRFSNDLARGPSCFDNSGIQVPPMMPCRLPPPAPQLPPMIDDTRWVVEPQEQEEQAMEVDYYDLPLLPEFSSSSSSSSDEAPLRLRYRSSPQSNPFRCVDDHDDDDDDVEEEMLYYYDY